MTVASTDDGSVTVRMAGTSTTVQLEPEVMRRGGYEIAQRIMACADIAYLKSQERLQKAWEGIASC